MTREAALVESGHMLPYGCKKHWEDKCIIQAWAPHHIIESSKYLQFYINYKTKSKFISPYVKMFKAKSVHKVL